MKVIDFFECNNRNYWLELIAKTDWRSGKYLYELLKSNSLHEKVGSFAKVLLLVDGDLLLAFCTVSEKKYDIDSQFSPWIGFVYTFPEHRGKHYSNLLLCYAEKIASEYGFDKIYISTKHITENYLPMSSMPNEGHSAPQWQVGRICRCRTAPPYHSCDIVPHVYKSLPQNVFPKVRRNHGMC